MTTNNKTNYISTLKMTIIISLSLFSCPCSSSATQSTLILPLKTQVAPGSSNNKLSFRHNVTLTVTLTVGSPPQEVSMVLDTGSELSWLHCKQNPTKTLASVYAAASSATFAELPCSSDTCRTRTRDLPIPVSCDRAKLCHVILSYADATSLEGTLATETFRVGSSTRPGTIFGCMEAPTYTSNAEEDAKATGLMGLNRGSMSFVEQMGVPGFSYCISGTDESGVLLLGGAASFAWLKPRSYTPMVRMPRPLPYFDRVAYSVALEGITVGGRLLPIPKSVLEPDHTGAGQTMLDSGTQFTFLLGPAYAALRNEFDRQARRSLGARLTSPPGFIFQGVMDLCYKVAAAEVAGEFPAVGLVLGGGAEMRVPGERAVVRVPGVAEVVYCMSFGNADLAGIEAYVIGNHHQQNLWMEFDLVNARVGFAELSCDLASQRLGL